VADLFRAEAMEHHGGRGAPGDVLRVAPRWTAWLFWLLLASILAGAVAAWVLRVDGDRLITVLLSGG
jgi:hypothetical protein